MTWPFENDTDAIIRRLSDARLRQNRFRNHLIGIIIFMAAAIMAFVSSYAYNITHKYAVSTAYQGIFQNLSQKDIFLLKEDSRIENIGVYQSVGMTEQKNGITMSMVYSDEITMQLSNIILTEGDMPYAADELLLERGYIDALNLKAEIGDTISIYYRNRESRQMERKDFRITGFIRTTAEDDRDRVAYNAIVSRNFVRENSALSAAPVAAMISVYDTAKYTNQELKELVRNIGLNCGISENNIQINNLYIDSNNMSEETVLTIFLVGLVLIGICSLVVYNIFFISVINHVTSFGQLRTIGTTKKQIRQIISKEGNYLALHFIPFGCIAGTILSFLVDRNAFLPFPDAVIVLFSGIIVFFCVRISILKPAKIAMSVSPVEAFRYSGYSGIKKFRKSKKHLTPFMLAAMNLFRNRKKSILTFISLVLSGTMFVGIASLLSSLDPEQRAKQSFPYGGSFVAELNRALLTPDFSLTELQENNPLSDELSNRILSIDGVEGIVCRQEIRVSTEGIETVIISLNAQDEKELRDKVINGTLPDHSDFGENSLVINIGSTELAYLQKSYEVGDRVTFSQPGSGPDIGLTYIVSAVICDRNSASTFILPEEEIKRTVPYNTNSAFIIQTVESDHMRIEKQLRSLILSDDTIRLKSLQDMVMQYNSFFGTISAAVYALLAVIAMFSVMNLVNTSMTDIISRRKEMGLFRAVGLDNQQLSHMTGYENAFLTLGSFAVSIVCGLGIGKGICSVVGNVPGFAFVQYTFPAAAVLLYFLLVLILQSALTVWAAHYCRKNSVVEQLRMAE